MEDIWDALLSNWWGKLLLAVVCFVVAWGAYSFFDDYETTGQGGRVPWWVALVYAIGGKWAAAAPFTLIGLLLGYGGLRQLRTGAEN